MKNRSAEIYLSLYNDLSTKDYPSGKILYRKYTMRNKYSLLYSMNVNDGLRSILVPITFLSDINKNLESCFGIDSEIETLPEYTNDQIYIRYSQNKDTDPMIFEIVAEDLRINLEDVSNNLFVKTSNTVIRKWKNYFSSRKHPILTSSEELGLYGELCFLKKLISFLGANIVNSWAGPGKGTHDFYIGKNAVEVKTTSSQAPYRAHISSEYQLDKTEVTGNLYLSLFAFRKDSTGTNTLPSLVNEIRKLIENENTILDVFNEKLLKVGYIDIAEELYTNSYHLRNEYLFSVEENFPCITRKIIPNGISDVEYTLAVDNCEEFAIDPNELQKLLQE